MKKWLVSLMILVISAVLCICAASAENNMVLPRENIHVSTLIKSNEPLVITFPAGQGVASYWANILDVSETWTMSSSVVGSEIYPRTETEPNKTNQVEYGWVNGHSYIVCLTAYDSEPISSATGKTFWVDYVTVDDDYETTTDGIRLMTSAVVHGQVRQVSVGMDTVITAYAPGAECIWLDVNGDILQGDNGSDIFTTGYTFNKAGSYDITATAIYSNGTTKTTAKTTLTAVGQSTNLSAGVNFGTLWPTVSPTGFSYTLNALSGIHREPEQFLRQ